MPQLDTATFVPQLIWLAITFIALYVILSRVALPRIGAVITEREDRVAADLAEAKWLKEKTDAAIAAYEQALAEARGRAHGIANQTRDDLAAKLSAEKAAAGQETAAKTAAAETAVQEIRLKSLGEIERIATETARALVEKLINAKLKAPAVQAAVSQAAKQSARSLQAE
jgi:F-type H+-transporting ATPase subunit b